MKKLTIVSVLGLSWALSLVPPALADEAIDPCAGLLSLLNRPSNADSACVVPFEKGVVEAGGRSYNLHGGAHGYDVPEIELRLGLPAHTEFTLTLPDYFHQTLKPHSGISPSIIGLKHEIGNNEHWLGAVEGFVILSGGSSAFGSNAVGGTVNGLVQYSFNPKLSMLLMLGVSTLTDSSSAGGGRFNTVNPDLLLNYQINDRWQAYGEVFGQSKTAKRSASGFNADAGVQFLFTKNLEGDLEVGQRISGQLGPFGFFTNYWGAGLAWRF